MKDFIKWLGVNEKVAKIAVWLLIIMVFLIVLNTALASLGFPNYQITYDNLIKVNKNNFLEIMLSCILCILNFYAIVLLVFRIKEAKPIFKYALIYLLLNWIVSSVFNQGVLQFFIIAYCIIFCYFYSKKNWKYLIYGTIAIIIDATIQGIWYTFKAQFIDYSLLNKASQTLLSLDYFIIIGIIILVKEIYLKKRGERNGFTRMLPMDRRIQKRRKTSQVNSKKSK